MNLKNEFNRLSGYFSDSMEKVHTATSDVSGKMRSQASDVSDKALMTLRQGTDTLVSAEETLINHIRGNSRLYLITGLLLLAAIIARSMLSEQPPMRRTQW